MKILLVEDAQNESENASFSAEYERKTHFSGVRILLIDDG
jgi:hypothetical protein